MKLHGHFSVIVISVILFFSLFNYLSNNKKDKVMKVIASHQLRIIFPKLLFMSRLQLTFFLIDKLLETKPINIFFRQIVALIVHFLFDCVNSFTYFIATSGNLLTLMKLHLKIGYFVKVFNEQLNLIIRLLAKENKKLSTYLTCSMLLYLLLFLVSFFHFQIII